MNVAIRWNRPLKTIGLSLVAAGLLAAAGGSLPIKAALRSVEPLRSYVFVPLYNVRRPQYPIRFPDEMGDGKNALEIDLRGPTGLAEDGRGNLYVADRGRFVWQIGLDGTAAIVAGTGVPGKYRTGIRATDADLKYPESLCLDGGDNLYLIDQQNHVLLRIGRNGILERIAGTFSSDYTGQDGPAWKASLDRPFDVRRDSQGNLYVADFGNRCIRKIDPRGTIRTVAGTGEAGYSGDGGPATQARLQGPYSICLGPADELYIADSLNHVIRKVDRKGIITTIAGTGQRGYSGDGGPAIAAQFNVPQSLFATSDGTLYIDDEHNHCIRVLDPTGRISTLIGNGRSGYGGDDVPRSAAQLNDPECVLMRRDGCLLISDRGNRCVRVLGADGRVRRLAGRGPT